VPISVYKLLQTIYQSLIYTPRRVTSTKAWPPEDATEEASEDATEEASEDAPEEAPT